MAIWIQSLSWALIWSIGQGVLVYSVLWLVFKLVPVRSANARYHLSLSALTVLLAWFLATWWQQYQSLDATNVKLLAANSSGATVLWLPVQQISLPPDLPGLQFLSTLLPWLTLGYIVGFVLMLAGLLAGVSHLFSLRSRGTQQAGSELDELLQVLRERLKVSVPVRLLVSVRAQVPMVIGFFKPVVLIPAAAIAQLDQKQLETILLHELAHIKRHDYLVNILQTVVETILFFNPFVWVIGKVIRREREHCCDDMVVGYTPEPLFYATALSVLASRKTNVPSIAIAASGRSTHLYDRIQRIMEAKSNPFSYSRMVATVVLIVTITCSIAWIKPTFSKTKKSKTTMTTTTVVEENRISDAPKGEPLAAGDKDTKPATARKGQSAPVANPTEEDILVQRLLNDKLVDQVRGFTVERRNGKLIINGQPQSDEVASKYLSNLKKEWIRVQVFSMEDRLRMHPNTDFLQLLLPVSLESPCVDKQPKEGC